MRWSFVAMLVACSSSSPQTTTHPKTDVAKGLPATLEATQPKTGDPRAIHIRIWADTAARAAPHWKDEINDQLDYAGQLLTPLLGVKLQVDAWKDWDHNGSDVHEALKALEQVDRATDVTWVIGYIAPAPTASKALAELGGADTLGHYIAIRGWADKPETDLLKASLPDLEAAQRADVIAAHKRHKQTVILLHAIAQTLGAIGEADPSWIQHPLYSPKQSTFSERNRELLQMAIDARLGAGTDQTIAHDLLEAIEKHEWGGWIPTDHDEVVKLLRNVIDASKSGKTAVDVPPAAYEQFDRVRELVKRGNRGEALIELDNLMVAYPGNAAMQQEKCELLLLGPIASASSAPAPSPPTDGGKNPGLRPRVPAPSGPNSGPPSGPKPGQPKPSGPNSGQPSGPKSGQAGPAKPVPPDKAALAACARVSELAPGDPSPHFAVGEALLRVNDVAGARTQLVAAANKIQNLKTDQPGAWRRLVAIYQGLGALTWAEDALTAGKLDADPAIAAIAQVRARYGVPKGTKVVRPEDEGALVAALQAANAAIYASKFADAERGLAAAEKKWPGAAGIFASRCDLALRQGSVEPARAACQRALTIDPDDSWALYLGGVLALKDTSAAGTKTGIEKLKKAITVDPDLGQAWRALAKAYDRAKDSAARTELAKAYQAKFNQALP